MTKCDFCAMSSPNGHCHWSFQAARKSDCEKAIRRMVEALKGTPKKNKKFNIL